LAIDDYLAKNSDKNADALRKLHKAPHKDAEEESE
jgi:hypothetical protein